MDKQNLAVGPQGYIEYYLSLVSEPNIFNVAVGIGVLILGLMLARHFVMYLMAIMIAAVVYVAASRTSFDFNWMLILAFVTLLFIANRGAGNGKRNSNFG